ncbi:MAG: surface-adhesin E family protein [Pseudomonadota bacterium]
MSNVVAAPYRHGYDFFAVTNLALPAPRPTLMHLKNILAALCLSAACLAPAQAAWFTVIGDEMNANVDTIQVELESLTTGDIRTLRVRVNRQGTRTSWDNVRYRSYESLVVFDCVQRKARYISIDFHMLPQWKGEAYKKSDYNTGPQRQMLFLDVIPNPSARIIRAACITSEPEKKPAH